MKKWMLWTITCAILAVPVGAWAVTHLGHSGCPLSPGCPCR